VAPNVLWFLPNPETGWRSTLDVVERLDTSRLHDRHPNDGVGRQAYDPDMPLAVLFYAYCTGLRSSRSIERLCQVDVAFRLNQCQDSPVLHNYETAEETSTRGGLQPTLSECDLLGPCPPRHWMGEQLAGPGGCRWPKC
jgi:hypothetical protein